MFLTFAALIDDEFRKRMAALENSRGPSPSLSKARQADSSFESQSSIKGCDSFSTEGNSSVFERKLTENEMSKNEILNTSKGLNALDLSILDLSAMDICKDLDQTTDCNRPKPT